VELTILAVYPTVNIFKAFALKALKPLLLIVNLKQSDKHD
jgi:hypothetical protein